MELIACVNCNKLFYSNGSGQRCSSCVTTKFEEIKQLSKFFTYKVDATIQEAEEKLGIDRKNIISYLREEKLELPPLSNDGVECKRCGKQIRTGKYCNTCRAELINGFNAGIKKEEKTEAEPRMRYLDYGNSKFKRK